MAIDFDLGDVAPDDSWNIGEDFLYSRINPSIYSQAPTTPEDVYDYGLILSGYTRLSELLQFADYSMLAVAQMYYMDESGTPTQDAAVLDGYISSEGLWGAGIDGEGYLTMAQKVLGLQGSNWGDTDSEVSGGFWLGCYVDNDAYVYGAATGDDVSSAKIYFMVNNHEDTDYPTTSQDSGAESELITVNIQGHEVGAIKRKYERNSVSDSYDTAMGSLIGTVLSASVGTDNILNFKRTTLKPIRPKNTSIFESGVVAKEGVKVSTGTRTSTSDGSY